MVRHRITLYASCSILLTGVFLSATSFAKEDTTSVLIVGQASPSASQVKIDKIKDLTPMSILPQMTEAVSPLALKPLILSASSSGILDQTTIKAVEQTKPKQAPATRKVTIDRAKPTSLDKKKQAAAKDKQLRLKDVDLDTAYDTGGDEQKAEGQETMSLQEIIGLAVIDQKGKEKLDVQRTLQDAYKALINGQLEASAYFYKKILKAQPKQEMALFGLAAVYQKNGQINKARELYKMILTKNPRHQDALTNMLVLIGEDKPDVALTELKRLESINPGFSPIPAQIGLLHAKMKSWDKAAVAMREALELSPDNMSYRYNLAVFLDHAGQKDQAIPLYRSLLVASHEGAVLPGSPEMLNDRLIYLSAQ